ncbi:type II secretion system protein [Phycisphaera mikurensis]|uniref:Prepilin-type N-terminal cleavage/methylation domain-containing protein n=1 Tax=Phycisphaera mikurensis (strain NBRC 102666 / KCTC 22515 / FYK2301M01) TaxID=1142394 RepID=I0IBY2_PHYMF|nr:prepilin-type N-terminal cleavage/methylation domain-containing protein [Phycisphaera mikurensis]MBB6442006.1 prepilin-type N-terminal cleavage/methylation domain-containing protein/prepilin-type processing-associated H-X9-DG protein [Phycisphaera mikurensis]BAM02770.1 hypothetical protein PSMK_06110 [Phycisphaera mikurensis NBRC 102666]
MSTSPPAPSTRAGFTLIELLVVISIIALLIGILLPALGAARNTARLSACLSNQRQISIAYAVYAADFKETWPLAFGLGTFFSSPPMPFMSWNETHLWPQMQGREQPWNFDNVVSSVFVCPEYEKSSVAQPHDISFGMNQMLPSVGSTGPSGPVPFYWDYKKPEQIKDATGAMVVIDNNGSAISGQAAQMQTLKEVSDRHMNAVTMQFADGHAESRKFEEIPPNLEADGATSAGHAEDTFWRGD